MAVKLKETEYKLDKLEGRLKENNENLLMSNLTLEKRDSEIKILKNELDK